MRILAVVAENELQGIECGAITAQVRGCRHGEADVSIDTAKARRRPLKDDEKENDQRAVALIGNRGHTV